MAARRVTDDDDRTAAEVGVRRGAGGVRDRALHVLRGHGEDLALLARAVGRVHHDEARVGEPLGQRDEAAVVVGVPAAARHQHDQRRLRSVRAVVAYSVETAAGSKVVAVGEGVGGDGEADDGADVDGEGLGALLDPPGAPHAASASARDAASAAPAASDRRTPLVTPPIMPPTDLA
ncbi:MAG: hypothetical protein U0S36_01495 [Candidatus Nanopelagicales bacterium]